ncbi:glutathione transferase GstA [Uliginosibacterium sp. H3]|uniref:Glutathione transferase GstA n=1 Tax=Uliginosibacterium silvisoli TaxID=3114758 RepID=A0ABU6K3X7_9RHOO|nr:glutathione transferase GstA [Uliginosibacterium sp. H3]
MKLFYAPGVCSLAPHIALREAGLEVELQKVDTKTKAMEGGGNFLEINPKGYVPVLQLDNGTVLTEGPVIGQYIADLKPESKLAPPAGTMERYRLQELLGFLNSEVHKTFGPLFKPTTPNEYKDALRTQLGERFDYLSTQLQGKQWLMGDTFTIADGYLFTLLGWTQWTHIDLKKWPVLADYSARVAARPAVQAALKAEGLLK